MNAAQKKAEAITAVKRNAQESGLEFFHDRWRKAWATVRVNGHRENWRVDSPELRLWVERALYETIGEAPNTWVNAIIEAFRVHALYDGPMLDVHVRVAEQNGILYIDLADEQWRAVEITPNGWNVVDQPKVKFRRSLGMAALPEPINGGGDLRELTRFLNIGSKHEILVLAWMTHAFRPNVPYPVLALSGVQGAGKSTTTKNLRSLVDPSLAELTDPPRNKRDLVFAASNCRVLAIDNMSDISLVLSDALCRAATGGAHRERKYHKNDGSEEIFVYQNPIIINGIGHLPQRPDLLDRCLLVHQEPISEIQRQNRNFLQQFREALPRLFGALLDVVCAGLRNVDNVKIASLPRMADFACWGTAIEETLGFQSGEFLTAYWANITDAHAIAVETSPIARTVHDYLIEHAKFSNTPFELLKTLNNFADCRDHNSPALVRKNPDWPKNAIQVSKALARIEPDLAKLGIRIERSRTRHYRLITLELMTMSDVGDKAAKSTVTEEPVENTQGVAA